MILSHLQNAQRIEELHPRFKEVFDYLRSHDLLQAECGRIELDGDRLFINNAETDCKPADEQLLEVHRDYIDIQLLLEGSETIGWKSLDELGTSSLIGNSYNSKRFFNTNVGIDVFGGYHVLHAPNQNGYHERLDLDGCFKLRNVKEKRDRVNESTDNDVSKHYVSFSEKESILKFDLFTIFSICLNSSVEKVLNVDSVLQFLKMSSIRLFIKQCVYQFTPNKF